MIDVKPYIEIVDIKVLNEQGKGEPRNIVQALELSIEEQVDIINISFGLESDNKLLKKVIDRVLSEGIIIVAAAGNTHGLGTNYPAAYEGVISISAVDKDFNRLKSSAKGKIDFVAPGKDILAPNNLGGYSLFTGTSYATAYATKAILTYIIEEQQSHEIYGKLKENAIMLKSDYKSYGNGLIMGRDVNPPSNLITLLKSSSYVSNPKSNSISSSVSTTLLIIISSAIFSPNCSANSSSICNKSISSLYSILSKNSFFSSTRTTSSLTRFSAFTFDKLPRL